MVSEVVEIELKRRKAYKEFKRDARKAVMEYVKELYPKTWFIHVLFSFVWLDGSWISYLKYTPIWRNGHHWFFQKWDFRRNGWHSDYIGWLRDDPDIEFEFYAWLCFRSGF